MTKELQLATQVTQTPTSSKSATDAAPLTTAGKSLTKVLGTFEEMVGGREGLIAALSTIELTEKEEFLLSLMEDPARGTESLFSLCRAAGVPAHSLMGLYRNAMTQQTERILYGGLPQVVEGVVNRARDGKTVCPECGNDEVLGKANCDRCGGVGFIYQLGNFDHQQLVMDAAKMLPKGGGVNVKVDQRVGVNLAGSLFDKFVTATDEAAYAIDGEIVEKEKPSGPESGRNGNSED